MKRYSLLLLIAIFVGQISAITDPKGLNLLQNLDSKIVKVENELLKDHKDFDPIAFDFYTLGYAAEQMEQYILKSTEEIEQEIIEKVISAKEAVFNGLEMCSDKAKKEAYVAFLKSKYAKEIQAAKYASATALTAATAWTIYKNRANIKAGFNKAYNLVANSEAAKKASQLSSNALQKTLGLGSSASQKVTEFGTKLANANVKAAQKLAQIGSNAAHKAGELATNAVINASNKIDSAARKTNEIGSFVSQKATDFGTKFTAVGSNAAHKAGELATNTVINASNKIDSAVRKTNEIGSFVSQKATDFGTTIANANVQAFEKMHAPQAYDIATQASEKASELTAQGIQKACDSSANIVKNVSAKFAKKAAETADVVVNPITSQEAVENLEASLSDMVRKQEAENFEIWDINSRLW